MSLDRSLKTGSGLTKHRNVLSRTERIAHLVGRDRFDMDEDDPMGLPKVANRKVSVAKSAKKKGLAEGEAVEGGAVPPAADSA